MIVVGAICVLVLPGCYAEPTITAMSPLTSWIGGNTRFMIAGDEFPSDPRIYIRSIAGVRVRMDTKGTGTNPWTFVVPDYPGTTPHNRPNMQACRLEIYFGDDDDEQLFKWFDGFRYLVPTLDTIGPDRGFLNSGGYLIRMTGNNLRLANNDFTPSLTIAGHTINAHAFTSTTVDFYLPDHDSIGNYNVELELYSGRRVTCRDQFAYGVPSINNFTPKIGTSGTGHLVTFTLINMIGGATDYTVSITVDGNQCNNINVISNTQVSCNVPSVNLAPGELREVSFQIRVGNQLVMGTPKFTHYHPKVVTVSPDRGLVIGGTLMRITGTYLHKAHSVLIGGVACQIKKQVSNEIRCLTGALTFADGVWEVTSNVQVIYNGGATYYPPVDQTFLYAAPYLTSLSPSVITDKGDYYITMKGHHLDLAGAWKIGTEMDWNTVGNVVQRVSLHIKLDSRQFKNAGLVDVQVAAKGYSSNKIQLMIGQPTLTADVTPSTGYMHLATPIRITTHNFPLVPTTTNLDSIVKFFIDGRPCTTLVQVDQNTFTCVAPKGLNAIAAPISFTLYNGLYTFTSDKRFTYWVPAITSLEQSNRVPKGTGRFRLLGTHLDIATGVTVNEVDIANFLVACTVEATKIECPMPSNSPGGYNVQLMVNDVGFSAPTNLVYEGPHIDAIRPHQGTYNKNILVTITGTGFGTDNSKVRVEIGIDTCLNARILPAVGLVERIECQRVANGGQSSDGVTVYVTNPTTNLEVESIENLQFMANAISCLGRREDDGSHSPVDWWFIYKIRGHGNYYLYIDSTMDRLQRYTPLQPINANDPLSPLVATYDQYRNYYYMFFNDQTGKRTDLGGRHAEKSHGTYGHVKGFIIYDSDLTGIHVTHSNPLFPSTSDLSANAFNGIGSGLKLLGAADLNQHFFCYQYPDMDTIMSTLVRSRPFLMKPYRVFNPSGWTQPEILANWRYYDYVYSMFGLAQRTVTGTNPAIETEKTIRRACMNSIADTANLDNICHWSTNFNIQGLGPAIYFQKTNTKVSGDYPAADIPRPVTLSPYILANARDTTLYEGIDLWMVAAATIGRKMFVETFFNGGVLQVETNEYLINVGVLDLPPYLSTQTPGIGGVTYSDCEFSSKSGHEHAKLGFPVYPAYDGAAYNANENMFCVGDLNRHNGQLKRGGGILCFQHPTLAYQFNRMVRVYNSKNALGIVHQRPVDGMFLFMPIVQPIQLTRALGWADDIVVELKDSINGAHVTRMPQDILTITSATATHPFDVIAKFSALRTALVMTGGNTEISLVETPPLLAGQDDIMNYVADDTFSIHYIAYNPSVSICDFVFGMTECTKDNARRTHLVNPGGPAVFPTAFLSPYGQRQLVRTFDVATSEDHLIIEFVKRMRTALSSVAPMTVAVDTTLPLSKIRSDGPFIMRNNAILCEDELAYLVTAMHIYQSSGATDGNTLLFNIGDDAPNWANGVLVAIAKKIYNSILDLNDQSTAFQNCYLNMVPNMDDIGNYNEADPSVLNPTQVLLYHRSAAAAYDLMSNTFSNGGGGRSVRLADDDMVPWTVMLRKLSQFRRSDNINSLSDLYMTLNDDDTSPDDPWYQTKTNNDILENNYLVEPQVWWMDDDDDHFMPDNGGAPDSSEAADPSIISLFALFSPPTSKSKSTVAAATRSEDMARDSDTTSAVYLRQDDFEDVLAIHELLNKSVTFSVRDILSTLTEDQVLSMNDAMEKWVNIQGKNQAIQVLLRDPMNQTSDQPVRFISELSEDNIGNEIDLCFKNNVAQVCSGPSITSITYFLESAIRAQASSRRKFGDLDVYFLPRPYGYVGSISSGIDGIAIATFNSKLCDIQMMTRVQFNAEQQFETLCSRVGPIVTNVSPLSGSTSGGDKITVDGLRFNSSVTVRFSDMFCESVTVVSSSRLTCLTPAHVGTSHPILLSTAQTIFNLQRTTYLFSYDAPTISSVAPSTADSNGFQIITITGTNFGSDSDLVEVTVDNIHSCWPIVGIDSQNIACYSPEGVGKFKSVQVDVDGQQSKYDMATMAASTFDYESPTVSEFVPANGDPSDYIVIHGDGFGDPDNGDPEPVLYLDDKVVDVVNFTNNYIMFQLDHGVAQQSLSIQVGDQVQETSFTYYPPYAASLVTPDALSTLGGLLQLNGYGWGMSSDDIDYVRLGDSIELSCNPFDVFVECTIPPGIGANLSISASVGDQALQVDATLTVSYSAPTITSATLINGTQVQVIGSNFVPLDMGVTFDPSTSYLNVTYIDGSNTLCHSFVSESYMACNVTLAPTTITLSVAGQLSNTIQL
ncbi:hypothetical protein SAMD00019534_047370 [Acytostelium subglobosum LB1]|uniref:hypothetical protein n=1 Tax=Acytostelium subglobosum LB1 TaxID=1410327 RepID=UPI0006450C82|nr:hypothetical protein SAMD00019534_047370 [Acytostelium subglobosum LB1]GAM21562.1 hypothetical protein SAMD00019534_047370 [Acytostelium subglobosum LB1]|eukprot:XP_012755681.1 hypothetical protein SAMD00019534_047370 [Acytostelium subglobosum LB1]